MKPTWPPWVVVTSVTDGFDRAAYAELAEAGLLEREVIVGPPLGVVYRLTDSGRALGPGLLKLGEWAELYMHAASRRTARRSPRRSPSKRPSRRLVT